MAEPAIWTPLDRTEYDAVWDRFYDRFAFKPSTHAHDWPGFNPPTPYVSFDWGSVEEGPSLAAAFDAINGEALRCFVAACPDVGRWLALDWQHESYWFDATAAAQHRHVWVLSVLPDGDYYSFLSPDMTIGTFGHPWEQTLTVFGEPLVASLAQTLATWLPVVRRADG